MAAEEEIMKMRLLVDGDGTGKLQAFTSNIFSFFNLFLNTCIHGHGSGSPLDLCLWSRWIHLECGPRTWFLKMTLI